MTHQQREWKDWVGELFAPSFDITVKDVLEDKADDTVIKSKIKRVSAFDPEAVQKVYEKVHMMTIMGEEMQKQSTDAEHKDGETKVAESASSHFDLDDSCIWSSDELAVLRQVFKSVKEHNVKLKVKCQELEKRNIYLEKQVGRLTGDKDLNVNQLSEAQKANSRLKIHCEHLQDDLDHANARLSAMEEIFQELGDEKASMVKEVQELRIQRDKDRMEKGRQQLQIESLKRQALNDLIMAEESIKIQCQTEIIKLEEKIKELTNELMNEKKVHGVTKKGLDHLRQHFASLPLSNIIPPNSVRENQVSDIDY